MTTKATNEQPKIRELPLQIRSAQVRPESLNEQERTVEMVWSIGAAVRRRDPWSGEPYDEMLSLDAEHVDLSRLNSGAPLLNSHGSWDLDDVIGVVERAWIEDLGDRKEGRALVRFSERESVGPIWKDVTSGIVRNVSVGYSVRAVEITEEDGKVPVWRAVDWQPMELSAVPIGADPGAGFRSEDKNQPCLFTQSTDTNRSRSMSLEQLESEDRSAEETGTPETTDQEDIKEAANIAAQRAITEERSRIHDIYDAQSKLGVERSVADDLVKRGTSLEESRKSLIDAAAQVETRRNISPHIVSGGVDEKQVRRQAVENALLHRFDPANNPLKEQSREWRGLNLIEMARAFLESEGVRVRGMSRDEIASRSLHSTSDFPHILAGVANKSLRDAYDAAPQTFKPFCRQGSASDFKDMHRAQLGEAPSLEKVNQIGEFKRGAIGEGKESYRVETYGKIFSISRQVLINDDLDAFTRVPQLFGTAAANLESDVVWSIITGNPKMADGKELFHNNHKNLAANGAALSVAALGKARAAMVKQTGIDGKTVIHVRPGYLLVPASLEMDAEQLVSQNLVPNTTGSVVPQSIRSLSIIAEPRLDQASESCWYLMANPNQIDTIEYAYLEGQEGVYLETRMGFDVDGIEIKARLDFGAKAIDWRGMYRNPGA